MARWMASVAPVAPKPASVSPRRHRRGAAGDARQHQALRHLRDGQLAAERGGGGGEGRHARRQRVGDAVLLQPADLLGDRAPHRQVAGMQPRDVLAGGVRRRRYSASISSSDSGAVSTIRAPGGQCASSSGARSSRHRGRPGSAASRSRPRTRDEVGGARAGADEMHGHAPSPPMASAQVTGADDDARAEQPRLRRRRPRAPRLPRPTACR